MASSDAIRSIPGDVALLPRVGEHSGAPPALIGAADVERAPDVCRHHEPFDVTFDGTDWFEQDVLWAAPADPVPLRALTALPQSFRPIRPTAGHSMLSHT